MNIGKGQDKYKEANFIDDTKIDKIFDLSTISILSN